MRRFRSGKPRGIRSAQHRSLLSTRTYLEHLSFRLFVPSSEHSLLIPILPVHSFVTYVVLLTFTPLSPIPYLPTSPDALLDTSCGFPLFAFRFSLFMSHFPCLIVSNLATWSELLIGFCTSALLCRIHEYAFAYTNPFM